MPDITHLTDIALDALEEELGCWQRIGTDQPRMTRLIRQPPMGPITCDGIIPDDAMQVVVMECIPDKDVNKFLTRMAMEKVVAAIALGLGGS